MEARVRASQTNSNWKDVYRAALLEDDITKIPQRILAAEAALSDRTTELSGAVDGDQVRESRDMAYARYFLKILSGVSWPAAENHPVRKHAERIRHIPDFISARLRSFPSSGTQGVITGPSSAERTAV